MTVLQSIAVTAYLWAMVSASGFALVVFLLLGMAWYDDAQARKHEKEDHG